MKQNKTKKLKKFACGKHCWGLYRDSPSQQMSWINVLNITDRQSGGLWK